MIDDVNVTTKRVRVKCHSPERSGTRGAALLASRTRYEMESIIRLESGYGYWPAYPILRYGVGLDLPLDRIFRMDIPFTMQLDYAHKKWDSRAEDEVFWNTDGHPQQVNTFSFGRDCSDGVSITVRSIRRIRPGNIPPSSSR
jgi:hypothetical protein